MNTELFAPIPKVRLSLYVGGACAILAGIGTVLALGGVPVWRAALWVLLMVAIALATIGIGLWLCAGRRVGAPFGLARGPVPLRLVAAIPFLWGVITAVALMKLLGSH